MPTVVLTAPHAAADRACRVLLLLTVAGGRGILVEDLIEQSGASRSTVYRDIERVKRMGWQIETEIDADGRATYRLAAWQKAPKLAKKTKRKKPRAVKRRGKS